MATAEEARKARKRQNRQSQIVYRERKRAAEAAQKERVHRLEDIIEEMSSVFVAFADEMMGYDMVKYNRNLVAGLRKTIKVMHTLAGEVVDSGDTEPRESQKESTQPMGHETLEEIAESNAQERQINSLAPGPGIRADDWLVKALEGNAAPRDEPSYQTSLGCAEHRKHLITPQFPRQIFGNGWMPQHGSFVDMTPPPYGTYLAPKTLSYNLVERTLESSYHALLEDELCTGRAASIMRWSIRHKDRESTLCHVRWMLGPGRHTVYHAVDFPASRYARLLSGDSKVLFDENYMPILPPEDQKVASGPSIPQLFSAMDVQKRLEDLGGREVDQDTMELTIRAGPPSPDSSWHKDGRSIFPSYEYPFLTTALTVRLSVSLLISNLATASVCLHVGPGFFIDNLYRAVEASLISAPKESVS